MPKVLQHLGGRARTSFLGTAELVARSLVLTDCSSSEEGTFNYSCERLSKNPEECRGVRPGKALWEPACSCSQPPQSTIQARSTGFDKLPSTSTLAAALFHPEGELALSTCHSAGPETSRGWGEDLRETKVHMASPEPMTMAKDMDSLKEEKNGWVQGWGQIEPCESVKNLIISESLSPASLGQVTFLL